MTCRARWAEHAQWAAVGVTLGVPAAILNTWPLIGYGVPFALCVALGFVMGAAGGMMASAGRI